MLKKALIAAAVAIFVPAAASAAPGHFRDGPAPAKTVMFEKNGHGNKFGYHNHGPKITYKTIFETRKVVKIYKVRGKFVKVVRWVKVPVKIAFINGRPIRM